MNLQRKIEIARYNIASIARHDDEELAVRIAALDQVVGIVNEEKAAAQQRVAERVSAMSAAPAPAPAPAEG